MNECSECPEGMGKGIDYLCTICKKTIVFKFYFYKGKLEISTGNCVTNA